MTKLEFMKELESLLFDIPLEEREEALQYYNGYFDDAGEDHEEEIIEELGSPMQVASIIKADLSFDADNLESRGYYTERGYHDTIYQEEKYEVAGAAKRAENGSDNEKRESGYKRQGSNTFRSSDYTGNDGYNSGTNSRYNTGQKAKNRNTNTGLIVLLIITCPIWIPVVLSILGAAIGLIAAFFAVIFCFGIAGIAMIGGGFALFIEGLIHIMDPLWGLLLCGSGLLIFGFGMLFTIACILICKNVLPAMVRGFVKLCRLPFRNRRVTV